MSIKTYRIIDVAILTVIACILEAVNMLTYRLFSEIFVLSIALPMSVIVMSRWGWWATITAVFAGLSYCVVMQVSGELFLIYALGNAFIAFNLFWFKAKKGSQIFETKFLTTCFVITAFIAISIGKALTALVFSYSLVDTFIKFIYSDALNLFIGIIIVLIASRQDTLMENQFEYLKRISVKNRKEEEEF